MAIVLSRKIKQNTKKRVLVCGDSFFHDAKARFPGLHWTQRLPNHIYIDNAATGGASNTMILDQFVDRFDGHDAVIFGFTSPWRVEFARPLKSSPADFPGKWLTNCHKTRMSPKQARFHDIYCELMSPDAEIVRQCSIMMAAVEMARTMTKVHYSLGGGDFLVRDFANDYPKVEYIKRFEQQQMPFNLGEFFGSDEYRPYVHLDGTDSHPPFHVHLPEIQQRFADQVCEFIDKA